MYRVSRTNTFAAEVSIEIPETNTISSAHTTGSQSQYRLICTWEPMASASSSASCTSRWMLHDSTVATGTTSRGTGSRLINPALSTIDVVPPLQAIVKKL